MSRTPRQPGNYRILYCCAIIAMILSITGCGGSSDDATEAPQPDPSTQTTEETPMPTPDPTGTPPPEDRDDLPEPILAAINALAMEVGVDPASVTVVEYADRQWPSTALGCPRPGFSYAQVVTDGFEVHLEVDGNNYRYHTNLGSNVVLCSRPDS